MARAAFEAKTRGTRHLGTRPGGFVPSAQLGLDSNRTTKMRFLETQAHQRRLALAARVPRLHSHCPPGGNQPTYRCHPEESARHDTHSAEEAGHRPY